MTKDKLLLFLAKLDIPQNVAVASTLAWVAKQQGARFDAYFDSYHQGVHFPGGDSRELELGQLTGGTVPSDRHFEEFYRLLLNFDVSICVLKDSIFRTCIANFGIPLTVFSEKLTDFYHQIFDHFGIGLPNEIVMMGTQFPKSMFGIPAYFYPEVYYRQAIGVPDSIPKNELASICQEEGLIHCLCVDEDVKAQLADAGNDVRTIDQIGPGDDYHDVILRTIRRWQNKAKGWILGDPTLVVHWLPTAMEEDLLSLYSVPQEKIIMTLGDDISAKGRVVLGRQDHDKNFFDLSKLDQAFQVIDPCRPAFQSAKHMSYSWAPRSDTSDFFTPEYSDEELRHFARDGRVLTSLMFWSGMIRETANFHHLMDLFVSTRLRCGLVLTAASFEYMMHSPLELLTIPLDRGGAFPLIEPVLGSCGLGVGIESLITNGRLAGDLSEALSRMEKRIGITNWKPRGWWPTLDADLERLRPWERPLPVAIQRQRPHIQIRFHSRGLNDGQSTSAPVRKPRNPMPVAKLKSKLREAGLSKYFLPYRPYESFRAGPLREDIIRVVKAAGLEYMFTKSGFGLPSKVQHIDDDFVVLNFTCGHWDGWTPFETVNDVSDLRRSEKRLLKRRRPGWLVGTIDSCLWTFGGEFWKRGQALYKIAQFCSRGGFSEKLINVKPYTIARYARIISESNA